jgi:arylsulfatase A-like enzyme
MRGKPNIVFAFADDWGRYASIYSQYKGSSRSLCENLDTPNFDQIAKEGVLFLNAIVPAPTCTPCRSSILSGQYFWQTGLGAILSGAMWDETIKTFPLELGIGIRDKG